MTYSQPQFFFSLYLAMRICIHCRKWYEESFHRNWLDSSYSISLAQVIYWFMSLFDLFIYCVVIANIFCEIDHLEPSFTYCVFCFHFRDSVSGFQIMDSGFRIPDSRFRIPGFSAPVFKSLDFPSCWNLTLQVLASTPPLLGGTAWSFAPAWVDWKASSPQ